MRSVGFLFLLISNVGWTQDETVIACPPSGPHKVELAYRIMVQPEKIELASLGSTPLDTTKRKTKQNSNELLVGIPETSFIYPGYWNILKVGFATKKNQKYHLKCDECDTLFRRTNGNHSDWIIGVENAGTYTIQAVTSSGKLLGEADIHALPLPKPTVYLDTVNSDSILSTLPNKLRLKYDETIPLSAGFVVSRWEATINNRTFIGLGSEITQDVRNFLETEGYGTIILAITYYSPVGKEDLKEIFEFKLR